MKPIIFTGPSLPAIASGAKTQTRRVLDPQPVQQDGAWYWKGGRALLRAGYGADYVHSDWYSVERAILKVYHHGQVGARRWVREAWAVNRGLDDVRPSRLPKSATVHYLAHGPRPKWAGRVRSPLHMPRWASRWEVLITAVRVQRLQAMSAEEARAEGIRVVPFRPDEGFPLCDGYTFGEDDGKSVLFPTALEAFSSGWDALNGHRSGASWAADPWVFALTFEAHRTRRAEAA